MKNLYAFFILLIFQFPSLQSAKFAQKFITSLRSDPSRALMYAVTFNHKKLIEELTLELKSMDLNCYHRNKIATALTCAAMDKNTEVFTFIFTHLEKHIDEKRFIKENRSMLKEKRMLEFVEKLFWEYRTVLDLQATPTTKQVQR